MCIRDSIRVGGVVQSHKLSLGGPCLLYTSFYFFNKRTFLPSVENVSTAIKAILEEADIETKEVIFSLPDFSTFFTSLTLPKMTKSELADAVHFEARKHIPIPFNEVVLDWELVGCLLYTS